MSNKQKHAILSTLKTKQDEGEENTGYGHYVTELGRTLSNIQIHDITNIPIRKINDLCYTMINKGHVAIFKADEDNKAHRFIITPSGMQTYIDKEYLNNTWYRTPGIIFPLVSLLVSILLSLMNLFWNPGLKPLKTDIKSLQQQIDSLQKKQ